MIGLMDCIFLFKKTRSIDKVDATMNAVNEQRELANEIAEALSNPINAGIEIDDVGFPLLEIRNCCADIC